MEDAYGTCTPPSTAGTPHYKIKTQRTMGCQTMIGRADNPQHYRGIDVAKLSLLGTIMLNKLPSMVLAANDLITKTLPAGLP